MVGEGRDRRFQPRYAGIRTRRLPTGPRRCLRGRARVAPHRQGVAEKEGNFRKLLGESRRTAKEFPKVAFLFGSGAGPAEPNFGVFDNWIHEPAYLSGLIAGKMSKTNTVGAVAAMGIPEVN